MKYTSLLKSAFFLLMLIAFNPLLFSQDCAVDIDALKGTYAGDCKKGKANGTGKAIGKDTYEGQFKSGVPDGEGIYIWSNGNTFKGAFQKGLKNGDGEMVYKLAEKPDSVVKGFWKKDVYVGRYEYSYKVLSKTKKISQASIKPSSSATGQQIVIWVSGTSSGASSLNPRGVIPKIQPSLILQRGLYSRSDVNDTYSSKSETILYDVTYPFRMRVEMEAESVDFLINEPGNYIVDISVNL